MNPEADNQFILEPEPAVETNPPRVMFPVMPQLIVLGLILLTIFSAFLIPKTFDLFRVATEDSNPTNNITEVQTTVDPFIPLATVPIKAEAAFVWDIKAGRPLYEKNAEEALPLASITKLMTALVAYELVPEDTPITISNTATAQESGGTLEAGETFAIKELVDFTLVSSFNSAAYMLAASVGELLGEADPGSQFIAGMNIKAEELGLNSLEFHNATGLDISTTKAGAYGSAREVSQLVEYILATYPEILLPTIAKKTRLYNTAGGHHDADNTNEIITDIPNLLGSKTGYTDLAGGNLTVVFDAGYKHPIVITVLGSSHSERFNDVKKFLAATQELLAQQ